MKHNIQNPFAGKLLKLLVTFSMLFSMLVLISIPRPVLAQSGPTATPTATVVPPVTISGNAGIAGAVLTYTDGALNMVIADINGNYTLHVSYGWSGTVKIAKDGYTFVPSNRTYSMGSSYFSSYQDYTATLVGWVSAGQSLTCWLKGDGTLGCWNDTMAPGLSYNGTYTQLSSAYGNTCFLNNDGYLGCSGPIQGYLPAYNFDTHYAQISLGSSHGCALLIDGTPTCWGQNIAWSPLVPPNEHFVQISSGYQHVCGLKNDGTVICWGDNSSGQATPPSGVFTKISAGYQYTCGIRDTGLVACWGTNFYGQATPPSGTFTQVSAAMTHTCGVKTDGTLACWGGNSYGQSTPLPGANFTQVSAGGDGYTCSIKNNSQIDCWGINFDMNSYAISGRAFPGATISYTDGTPKTVTADSLGYYNVSVPYNWSGTVTPSKSGVTFTPGSKSYVNVSNYYSYENYTAVAVATVKSIGTQDGWIAESGYNTGVGGSLADVGNTFTLGDTPAKKQYRAILSFDTTSSSIPSNAIIQSAVLRLKYNSMDGVNPFTSLGSLRVDIKQGSFGMPGLELGDFNAASSAGQVSLFNETPVNNWYSATIDATGRSYLNLAGLSQFRLRFTTTTNNDAIGDDIRFISGDYTTNQPELVITYTLP